MSDDEDAQLAKTRQVLAERRRQRREKDKNSDKKADEKADEKAPEKVVRSEQPAEELKERATGSASSSNKPSWVYENAVPLVIGGGLIVAGAAIGYYGPQKAQSLMGTQAQATGPEPAQQPEPLKPASTFRWQQPF